MTHDTPPKRIWADQDNLTWVEEFPGEAMKDCEAEYILASEHAALILEAEARWMERAANVDWQRGRDVIDPAPDFLSDWQRGLVAGQQMMRDAILAEAASIRAAKATP